MRSFAVAHYLSIRCTLALKSLALSENVAKSEELPFLDVGVHYPIDLKKCIVKIKTEYLVYNTRRQLILEGEVKATTFAIDRAKIGSDAPSSR